MNTIFKFSFVLCMVTQIASATSILCNTDGSVLELKFNKVIVTEQGDFYSFIGQSQNKKLHVLYPELSKNEISLSVANIDTNSSVTKVYKSDTRSLHLESEELNISCTNPLTYNNHFLKDLKKENEILGKSEIAEQVDGNFFKLIQTKYKNLMISKIIADAKDRKVKMNEKAVRTELEAGLVAKSVDYENKSHRPKGTFSISWGYHRTKYAQSEVHIWKDSTGTDFWASDVDAVDAPNFEAILPRKGHPYQFDVPQYQVRIAYMLPNGKWGIELSQEHLKYKMKQRDENEVFTGQDKFIEGNYFGEHIAEVRNVGRDDEFYFEHTDGLNPISLNLIRNFNVVESRYGSLDVQGTVGSGVIVPATLSVIHGQLRDDKFSIVGYDLSASGRIRYTVGPVFLQTGLKYHHINVVKGKLVDDHFLHQYINGVVLSADLGVNINFNSKKK